MEMSDQMRPRSNDAVLGGNPAPLPGATSSLIPPIELILAELGINPDNLRAGFPIREERLHYRAAMNWFAYKPKFGSTNLEQIRGLLEAFHHFCEAKDRERASKILSIRLNNNETLYNQLGKWGYHQEQINLRERLKLVSRD